MEASAYALKHGVHSTRVALSAWRTQPWPVLRAWLLVSLAASGGLLLAALLVALLSSTTGSVLLVRPPFAVGQLPDVARILRSNMLVLALHALACVAGFIAGSSLPVQAKYLTGWRRQVHERGRLVAIGWVALATAFSLSLQAYRLGHIAATDAATLHTSALLLLVSLLPHALPELVSLFLPLAAWITASRRADWGSLLAATLVTVALAIPILVLAGLWEVYGAPHLLKAMFGLP